MDDASTVISVTLSSPKTQLEKDILEELVGRLRRRGIRAGDISITDFVVIMHNIYKDLSVEDHAQL